MPNNFCRIAAILPQEVEYSGRLLEGAAAYVAEHRHLRLVDLPYSVDSPESGPFGRDPLPFDAALVWATTEAVWIKRLLSDSIPMVAAGGDWPANQIPIVAFDGEAVAEIAIEHLIRRKPASLAHLEFLIDGYEVLGKRARYFQRVAKQLGVPAASHQLLRAGEPDDSSLGRRSPLRGRTADRLLRLLRSLDLPAGVWCGDDQLGLRVCEQAEGLGLRIPEDLAVLGLGDFRCAISGRPPLSTIPLPGALIGYRAFEVLDRKLAGAEEFPPEISISPPSVIARESTVGQIGHDPIGKALALITDRACDGITVGGLAAQAGVTPQTLHARCIERTGHTPGELIKREKVATAKRLLSDPRLSIGQVAEQCGYEQQSNFSNFFRRETGLSPRAWRQSER